MNESYESSDAIESLSGHLSKAHRRIRDLEDGLRRLLEPAPVQCPGRDLRTWSRPGSGGWWIIDFEPCMPGTITC